MGDRAVVQLVRLGEGSREVSPVLYLHWDGGSVPELLDGLAHQMGDRLTDVSYSFARLVGRAVNKSGGDAEALSVGVFAAPDVLTVGDSHGDAGVFVVDVATKTVSYGGGYAPNYGDSLWTWVEMEGAL